MKTVFLIGDSVYPDSFGGSHRHVYDLASALVKDGYNVHVIVPNPNKKFKEHEYSDMGFEYWRYPRNRNNKVIGLFQYLTGPLRMIKKLEKRGIIPDIIHSHWAITNALIFKKYVNSTVKLIHTMHGPCAEEFLLEKKNYPYILKHSIACLYKNLEQSVFNNADYVIVASNYMKEKAVKNYSNKKKVRVIPVFTDIHKFDIRYLSRKDARNQLGITYQGKIIVSVRRLAKRMGLDNLIYAMKYIISIQPNIYLLIGGKGDYEPVLYDIIRKNDLQDHVKMLGFVSEDVLPCLYEAADLVVIPSLDLEGFGLVTTEAMASGTPVVATPRGGNVEVVGGFSERYLSKGVEPEQLANTILDILIFSQDRNREEYRSYVVDNFSCEKVTDKIERLYNEN